MAGARTFPEQISTAGTEASGTGNMKLALNGALTIGHRRRREHRDPPERRRRQHLHLRPAHARGTGAARRAAISRCATTSRTHSSSRCSTRSAAAAFSPGEPGALPAGLVDALLWGGDHYLLLADYASYVETQARVDALYRQSSEWALARKSPTWPAWGVFSSDPHDPRICAADLGRDAAAVASGALLPSPDALRPPRSS